MAIILGNTEYTYAKDQSSKLVYELRGTSYHVVDYTGPDGTKSNPVIINIPTTYKGVAVTGISGKQSTKAGVGGGNSAFYYKHNIIINAPSISIITSANGTDGAKREENGASTNGIGSSGAFVSSSNIEIYADNLRTITSGNGWW